MSTASQLFHDLAFDAHSPRWNEDELPLLSRNELRALALLTGCPKSGTKPELMVRLLAIRHVRLELSKYASDRAGAEAVAGDFRKERLKWMAKMAGLWRSGNKLQLSIVLLNWRTRCRHEGQKFLNELLAQGRPKQLSLL